MSLQKEKVVNETQRKIARVEKRYKKATRQTENN